MMGPADFLEAVWPARGVYALATYFKIPSSRKLTYVHHTFGSIAEAAAFVEKRKASDDIFFAVHTLREPKVWNPNKINPRTGAAGAYQIRTQSNMCEARCFFFDLDVEAGNPKKYASQAEAAAALKSFCTATGLPKPLVTSSGGGLHVYWILDDPIRADDWRQHASTLKQVAANLHLKADPSRTTDTASVLRVAGTSNLKSRANPRPVKALTSAISTPNDVFLAALARAAVTVEASPAGDMFSSVPDYVKAVEGNIGTEMTGPPVTLKAVAQSCAQMRRLIKLQGNVSEPEWYASLSIVRLVENGEKYVHKISSGHPKYSAAETNDKVAQLESKGIGPATCVKLAEVCGTDLCAACPLFGRVVSPMSAARLIDSAPDPVVTARPGSASAPTTIPPAPHPFTRLKGGGISRALKNADGDIIHQKIYDYDLYPTKRIVNTLEGIEQQVWCAILPREEPKEFVLDADALYDRRKFVVTISNHGIYPAAALVPDLQDYMVAYIAQLQRSVNSEPQHTHLGWTKEMDRFILPDKVFRIDGTVTPATLGIGATRSTTAVTKAGTLERQVDVLSFYDHPAYVRHQFFILGSLAAPLFHATGHHGVIINASGPAGASKSTTLYTAASLWGQPEMYPLNGTSGGATVNARNSRVAVLSNLPTCVDEITLMPVKEAHELAMNITQPGERLRLTKEGVERAGTDNHKATIMLATANSSLHGLLSVGNAAGTAGSMRVVEILFTPTIVHRKFEADDYWHNLKQNYGHVGEVFIEYVVNNKDQVDARVRREMRRIDEEVSIQSSERFWSAVIATIIVAGEIAQELGLLPFDVAAIRKWVLNEQIPFMRGVVVSEYSTPIGVLADYLEEINGDTIITAKSQVAGNLPPILKHPRGQLLAHYDTSEKMIWVLKKGFKDYCARIGANSLNILDDLNTAKVTRGGGPARVVPSKQMKKVLGAGTDYAKAQTWCFSIDMRHPDISGVVDLGVVSNPEAQTTPSKGDLRDMAGGKP